MSLEVIFESFSSNAIIIVLGLVILLAVILIIIEVILNKKPAQPIIQQNPYSSQARILLKQNISAEKKLDNLNTLAKAYFKEKLNIDKLSYAEIAEVLKADILSAKFCSLMSELYYSQSKPDELKIKKAIFMFLTIIRKAEKQQEEIPKIPEVNIKKTVLQHAIELNKKEITKHLERISILRQETERILKVFRGNKIISALQSKKESMAEIISKDKQEYTEIKKLSFSIKKIFNEFNNLIASSADKVNKAKIKNLIDDWRKDNKKVAGQKNPILAYFEELQILNKYLSSLGIILTREIVK